MVKSWIFYVSSFIRFSRNILRELPRVNVHDQIKTPSDLLEKYQILINMISVDNFRWRFARETHPIQNTDKPTEFQTKSKAIHIENLSCQMDINGSKDIAANKQSVNHKEFNLQLLLSTTSKNI